MSDWDSSEETKWDYQCPPLQQQSHQHNSGTHGYATGRYQPRRCDERYQKRGDGNWEEPLHPEFDPNTMLEIPSEAVGRVIGRQGSKVQELESISGAKINITKNARQTAERGSVTTIRFKGNSKQISKAKKLVEEVVNVQGQTTSCEPAEHKSNSSAQSNLESNKNSLDNENAPSKTSLSSDTFNEVDWIELAKECKRQAAVYWASFPPVQKEFYVEHPDISRLCEEDVKKIRRQNNNITVCRLSPEKLPMTATEEEKEEQKATIAADLAKPIQKPIIDFFHAFHNFPEILDVIQLAGFTRPSPVQMQAWPVLLSGEDMIGIAQTGTGKTLAFLLPALIHIDRQLIPKEERSGASVLVLAPTRELALQIEREVNKYSYKNIRSVCLYGGGNRQEQIEALRAGVEIIIATPGRLNDLVAANHVDPVTFTYIVLDEADRMLDMGFEPQIRKVLYATRPTRQTVMTSATWPIGVRRLKDSYMKNPVQINVGSLDLTAVHSVRQTIEIIDDIEDVKFNSLVNFVNTLEPVDKVIIFCGKKSRADHICSELCLMGFRAQALHGDREQCDREQALLDIMDGTIPILVATDVASRGIDIEDIAYVVNYDFPRNIEEYVHRVGRTGRAGRTGESISYFTRSDWAHAAELIPILEEANQVVPTELEEMAKRYNHWKKRKDSEGPRPFRGGRRGGRPRY